MKLCIDCKHYARNPQRGAGFYIFNPGPIHICSKYGIEKSQVTGGVMYENARDATSERKPPSGVRCGPEAIYFEPKSQLTDQTRKGILARIKGMIWG